MKPTQAYEWLAPKLDISERKVLDIIYAAICGDASFHPLGTPAQDRQLLASVPQQRQRQDGTDAQLLTVMAWANRLGCYDAADVIRGLVERGARSSPERGS